MKDINADSCSSFHKTTLPPLNIEQKTERNVFTSSLQSCHELDTQATSRQREILSQQDINYGMKEVLREKGKILLFQLYQQLRLLGIQEDKDTILMRINEIIEEYIWKQQKYSEIVESLKHLRSTVNDLEPRSEDVTPKKLTGSSFNISEIISSIKQKTEKQFSSIEHLFSQFKRMIRFSTNCLGVALKLKQNKQKINEIVEFGQWYKHFSVPIQQPLSLPDLVYFVDQCVQRLTSIQVETMLVRSKLF